MKTTTTFIYNVLAAVALLLCSMQGFSQDCVSCDTLMKNIRLGFNNTVNNSWEEQTILGNNNTTSQNNAVVIGTNSMASRSHSYIFGSFSESNGLHSYVIGSNSIADKTDNFAIGNTAQSMSGNGFAIGNYTKSFAEGAYVLGLGRSLSIPLENTVKNSLAIGFKSNVPTLFVSESPDVNRTGSIGIGNVTDPQAKLHIRADEEEHATLRLEATGSNKHSRLYFSDDIYLTASPQNNLSFTLPENNNLIFENGNVGIGTSQPQAKLHVHGDFQVGDTANPQNMRLYGSINATGEYATAFGTGNTAGGNYSFVAGENSKANGRSSFSLGQSTNVYDNYALGIGRYLEVYGSSSLAIGRYLKTLSSESMVIGYGFSETQTLDNNVNRSLMIGFGSTKPTLFVGPSTGVNNTGKIGIGNVTDPQAKLHIRADEEEHATLRLEATGSNKHSRLYFSDDIYLTASPQNNLSFTLPENNNLIFENGKVGIGTNDPQARLQVVGSMIAGGNNIASGANAIAIGTNTTASGYSSFASGNLSIASGEVSTAIGGNVTSSAPSAITIGRFLNASGSRSMVLGSGKDNTLRLTNGIPHTLMIGFSSDKPTIFVSETPYGYQTGKIGIGNVTDPQAKLHIRADENEHATLRLEATGSDKHSSIAFSGEHFIIAKENDHLSFNTSQDKTFLFHNGDIFIEDITKGIIMKSPNGQCWRGVLSDNGQLVFSVVTCPDGSANVPEPSIEPALQMKIYPNPTDGTITIEVPDGVNNADWSLRSTDGALLMRNRITSGKTEISLTNFVAGVYVISIEQNGRLIASEKVVKQ